MPYKNPEKQLEYQRRWMQNRRKEFLSGQKCLDCDTSKNLEIDHISGKTDHRIWSWTKARIIEELKKCEIRCKQCHKLRHGAFTHGTRSMYKKHKCRCSKCKKWRSKTWKEKRY